MLNANALDNHDTFTKKKPFFIKNKTQFACLFHFINREAYRVGGEGKGLSQRELQGQ